MPNSNNLNLKIGENGKVLFSSTTEVLDIVVPTRYFLEFSSEYWLYNFETKELELLPNADELKAQAEAEEAAVKLQAAMAAKQAEYIMLAQERLDSFAKTRNYHNALSAATYATSTVPRFKAEGQYMVEARDATWAAMYTILSEVGAGTRKVPNSFEDIENELPVLTWPK